MQKILYFTFIVFFVAAKSFAQDYAPDTTRKLVKITTTGRESFIGEIKSEDNTKIILYNETVGNITVYKNSIRAIEPYVKTSPEKNDMKEYFLAPSAYTLKPSTFSIQTHYYGYWNFEIGIAENLSMDFGVTYPLLMPIKMGIKSGFNISENVRLGCKINAYSFFDLGWSGQSRYSNQKIYSPLFFLLQANPVVTFGNSNANFSIGGSVNYLTKYDYTGFGAFAAGYYSITERLGVCGEAIWALPGADADVESIYWSSFGLKYAGNKSKTWSFGISSIAFPFRNYNYSTGTSYQAYFFIPFPYIGFRKEF